MLSVWELGIVPDDIAWQYSTSLSISAWLLGTMRAVHLSVAEEEQKLPPHPLRNMFPDRKSIAMGAATAFTQLQPLLAPQLSPIQYVIISLFYSYCLVFTIRPPRSELHEEDEVDDLEQQAQTSVSQKSIQLKEMVVGAKAQD